MAIFNIIRKALSDFWLEESLFDRHYRLPFLHAYLNFAETIRSMGAAMF